jgi:hypothetical protein
VAEVTPMGVGHRSYVGASLLRERWHLETESLGLGTGSS